MPKAALELARRTELRLLSVDRKTFIHPIYIGPTVKSLVQKQTENHKQDGKKSYYNAVSKWRAFSNSDTSTYARKS